MGRLELLKSSNLAFFVKASRSDRITIYFEIPSLAPVGFNFEIARFPAQHPIDANKAGHPHANNIFKPGSLDLLEDFVVNHSTVAHHDNPGDLKTLTQILQHGLERANIANVTGKYLMDYRYPFLSKSILLYL